jgi:hypothetical protein
MTQNPTYAGSAPPTEASNGDSATRSSTVTNASPEFVTETRTERTAVATPAAQGQPAGTVQVDRTTMFAGDPAYRGVQMVWVLLGITELFIGLRVMFRALNSTDTGFVSFVYGLGGAFAAPFRGIANWTSGTTVIEVGSLIAMAVYVLAAFLVIKVVRIATSPHRSATA